MPRWGMAACLTLALLELTQTGLEHRPDYFNNNNNKNTLKQKKKIKRPMCNVLRLAMEKTKDEYCCDQWLKRNDKKGEQSRSVF